MIDNLHFQSSLERIALLKPVRVTSVKIGWHRNLFKFWTINENRKLTSTVTTQNIYDNIKLQVWNTTKRVLKGTRERTELQICEIKTNFPQLPHPWCGSVGDAMLPKLCQRVRSFDVIRGRINDTRSLVSQYIKGVDKSLTRADSSIPLINRDMSDLWMTDHDPDHHKGRHPSSFFNKNNKKYSCLILKELSENAHNTTARLGAKATFRF